MYIDWAASILTLLGIYLLTVKNKYGFILAGISSVLRSGGIATDFVLQSSHPEFHLTGLRRASVFRMHKLATVSRSVIIRRLGRIGPQLQVELDRLLRVAVGL